MRQILRSVAGVASCVVLGGSALATGQCVATSGTVANGITASVVDLGINVDERRRRIIQFDTPFQVTTDGAADSFSAAALPERRGLNNICNHVTAYRLNSASDRIGELNCSGKLAAMASFRDSNWVEPPGVEIVWRQGITSRVEVTPDGERTVPCVFSSGPYAGFFGTKTNLTHGLTENRGECAINDQIDPRQVHGVTIQGGRNFIRDAGVQLGDLAIVSMRRPNGQTVHVPAVVIDSGGVRYPAMGTVSLNAALLGQSGPFETQQSVFRVSIDAPRTVTVTVLPGSFGYRLQRPFTNENVAERVTGLLAAAGYSSNADLVSAATRCRSAPR